MLSPIEIGLIGWSFLTALVGIISARQAYHQGYINGVVDSGLTVAEASQRSRRNRLGKLVTDFLVEHTQARLFYTAVDRYNSQVQTEASTNQPGFKDMQVRVISQEKGKPLKRNSPLIFCVFTVECEDATALLRLGMIFSVLQLQQRFAARPKEVPFDA